MSGEYQAIILIVAFILLTLLIVLVLPPMLRQSRIASRARRDYEQARGTHHLRQIRKSLGILDDRLKDLEKERLKLKRNIGRLTGQRSSELSSALCRHIAQTHLTDIDGIGPKLRDRIIATCFDGTLDSLTHVENRVYGVGQKKALDIRMWVLEWKPQLPDLFKEGLPDKATISEKYDRREQELGKRLRETEGKIQAMNDLLNQATTEEKRLSQVTVAHFRQAYREDKDASQAVDEYLQGAFPEWAPMPSWFKTLISEYEG
jgi:hypothetical protein